MVKLPQVHERVFPVQTDTADILARAVVAETDWRQCELASGEIDLDRLRVHIAAAIRAYGRWVDTHAPSPSFTCPGCGKQTNVIFNRSSCPLCTGRE